MKIGYIRVSTNIQAHGYSLEEQEKSLKAVGCEKIYSDTASGKDLDRASLQELLSFVRQGDIIVVCKLDRLGRSLKDLIALVTETFEKKGIGFISITERIDTSNPMGKLVFHLFGALAEFERDLIKERTHKGIEAARARGKSPGRPRSLTNEQIEGIRTLHTNVSIPIIQICQQYNIKKSTLYKYLKK